MNEVRFFFIVKLMRRGQCVPLPLNSHSSHQTPCIAVARLGDSENTVLPFQGNTILPTSHPCPAILNNNILFPFKQERNKEAQPTHYFIISINKQRINCIVVENIFCVEFLVTKVCQHSRGYFYMKCSQIIYTWKPRESQKQLEIIYFSYNTCIQHSR